MAGVSSLGAGSGLDLNSIVERLMALERRPVTVLQGQRTTLNAQISAYGQLKSALSAFRDAMKNLASEDKFRLYAATSSDADALTATADSTAASGQYSIEVVNLAVAHKLRATASVANKDSTTIGAAGDRMTLTVAGESLTVDIGGKTLAQIRDAINDATDNPGVTASIISVSSTEHYLTLTADDTGTAQAVTRSFSNGGSPIADPFAFTEAQAAEDAQIRVDGFPANPAVIARSSNVITDVVAGVTLTLKAEGASPVTISVARDDNAVKEAVQKFVDAYNTVQGKIAELRAGRLGGDNTLLSLERQIGAVFNSAASGIPGGLQYLSEVGISTLEGGKLALDGEDLSAALASNFAGVAQLFGNESQGFAARLKGLLDNLLAIDGLVDARQDGLSDRVELITDRIDQVERRLIFTEQRLRKQFASLDTLLGTMQTTSSYLASQLQNLNRDR